MRKETNKPAKPLTRMVRTRQGMVRTADNPINTWVRSLDDGKFYRTC